MLTVTERFAQWLEKSGLNQSDVARQLGRHRSFVTQIRKGIRRPVLDDAAKLEALTGIPAAAWAATPSAPSRSGARKRTRKVRVAHE